MLSTDETAARVSRGWNDSSTATPRTPTTGVLPVSSEWAYHRGPWFDRALPKYKEDEHMRLHGMNLTAFFSFIAVTLFSAGSPAAERAHVEATFDVVIANGRIVDGSGNPWFSRACCDQERSHRQDRQRRCQIGQTRDRREGDGGLARLHRSPHAHGHAGLGRRQYRKRRAPGRDARCDRGKRDGGAAQGRRARGIQGGSQAAQRRRRRLDHARRVTSAASARKAPRSTSRRASRRSRCAGSSSASRTGRRRRPRSSR